MQPSTAQDDCLRQYQAILERQNLIIVSNRGPFSFQKEEDGSLKYQRSGGGLVTALLGLAKTVPSTWIACATSPEDRQWGSGEVELVDEETRINICFVNPTPEAYEGYYGVIANPLLWFLQHSIWDVANAPVLNRQTWQAWREGYVEVNRLVADAVVDQVRQKRGQPAFIMLQDYHLYLAPRMIRQRLRNRRKMILTHFIHIPWPGPEDWSLLPCEMREAILEGLCAVDLLGFQTREDALNFLRTCESLLPGVRVNYRMGRAIYRNHVTYVRDFPISIDVPATVQEAASEEAQQYYQQLLEGLGDLRMILRVDRTEPSKNIVRGFLAYEELLETHPEHHQKVQFLALLVPSRLEVEEYQDYLNSIMATAGRINAVFGNSDWEPVRVLVGDSYPRALAAMQLYDVLLVNPVADGMNLVAKEGPSVNQKNGVVVLSERAGAHQQLGEFATVVAPVDVSATAEALHEALMMSEEERKRRADGLKDQIQREDIRLWLCWQLDTLQKILDAKK
jgi:trehalose 6-phosphate synthase